MEIGNESVSSYEKWHLSPVKLASSSSPKKNIAKKQIKSRSKKRHACGHCPAQEVSLGGNNG